MGVYSRHLTLDWFTMEYILVICHSIGSQWSIFSSSATRLVHDGVYSRHLPPVHNGVYYREVRPHCPSISVKADQLSKPWM